MAASAQLRIRVQPGARRTEVVGLTEGVLRVRVAAPPVEGRANATLLAFLAEALGVRPWAVHLRRGAAGREKLITVEGMSTEAALARLLGPQGS
ncbi:MAG: DUF167 domain-containing protein [Chloroflexi bacterium]|nr:DUF167 domain-containing protein [Chloroflexota bacterium]